jgi:hypothetical protein
VNALKTLRNRLVALATTDGFESSRANQIGKSNDLSGSLAVATGERCESARIRLP